MPFRKCLTGLTGDRSTQKINTTLRRIRTLPIAVLTVLALLSVPTAASAAENLEGVIRVDGRRTVAYSGRIHYSARADLTFTEFCVENSILDDGYTGIAYSRITYYDRSGRALPTGYDQMGVTNTLGCFKHQMFQPLGTNRVVATVIICAHHPTKRTICERESESWG